MKPALICCSMPTQSSALAGMECGRFGIGTTEKKPILLSIGYSTCHWCHVMAHESFEDGATAQLMNELFVNIKVDREERPAIDKIYQSSVSTAYWSGGWPLTMFLMSDDHAPFFASTYFRNTLRYNIPTFQDVSRGVAPTFNNKMLHC